MWTDGSKWWLYEVSCCWYPYDIQNHLSFFFFWRQFYLGGSCWPGLCCVPLFFDIEPMIISVRSQLVGPPWTEQTQLILFMPLLELVRYVRLSHGKYIRATSSSVFLSTSFAQLRELINNYLPFSTILYCHQAELFTSDGTIISM
jgi:hypothetical protein